MMRRPISPPSQLDPLLHSRLEDRRRSGRLREIQSTDCIDATHLEIGGRRYVNFSSNNYLGLNLHPRVIAAAIEATSQCGAGTGAAALVCGHTAYHAAAELAIARWKQTEAAVLLPSGYQANHAAVQTLAALAHTQGEVAPVKVRFILDKLVHASILDAVAGTGLPMRVFPHNGLEKLERLVKESPADQLNVVITESIFSMDGDAADLAGLARLKKSHPFVLVLDEAHGSGVYGLGGAGYASECGLSDLADASIVTLSKAVGAMGGAICASRTFCDGVINFGRAFIYSTNIPAGAAAAAQAAIEVMATEPWRQKRLRDSARLVRQRLIDSGFKLPAGDSPILAIILGSEEAALNAAKSLRNQGLLVTAVRPPTVAPGASRLRITLCSDHTDAEINLLLDAVIRLKK